jgi:hypothetical protein
MIDPTWSKDRTKEEIAERRIEIRAIEQWLQQNESSYEQTMARALISHQPHRDFKNREIYLRLDELRNEIRALIESL